MPIKALNSRLIKSTIRVVFLTIWVAYVGCIGAQTVTSAAPNKQSVQYKLDEFVQSEAQAVATLRGGVTRLTRMCAAPLKPLEGVASATSLKDVAASLQVRGALQSGIADKQLALTEQAVQAAQKEQDQACGIVNNWLTIVILKVATPEGAALCEVKRARTLALKNTRNQVSKWRELQRERQQLFEQLVQLETAECTRPGFTQRMLQAHESALGRFEDQLPEMFEAVRSAP